MANTYTGQIIYLDDFTSAVDISSQFPKGVNLHSIEWVSPDAVDDACIVKYSSTGPNVIEWECWDVGRNHIKYFHFLFFETLYIDANGVDSGALILIIR